MCESFDRHMTQYFFSPSPAHFVPFVPLMPIVPRHCCYAETEYGGRFVRGSIHRQAAVELLTGAQLPAIKWAHSHWIQLDPTVSHR